MSEETDSKSERRKWRRLDHELRVQLHALGGMGPTIMALGTHLSPDGIFVQLADPPAAETKVRVSIVGSDNDDFQLTAEGVVTNQFVPDTATDVTGVGIRLTDAGVPWRKLYDLLS